MNPLYLAAENGHLEVVRFLFEDGANKNRADEERMAPLCLAAENGPLEVVRFLFEVGANKNRADDERMAQLYTWEPLALVVG